MPVANNAGGNLNLFVFEVGILTRDPITGATISQTLALHPLLVAPSQYSCNVTSRSVVEKTATAFWAMRGGLGPLLWNFSGTWGKVSRGLGIYVGDGETRHTRFLNEVVRLPEAVSKEDAAACYDLLTGTPSVGIAVAAFNPDVQVFYVNMYDLWDGWAGSVKIDSYHFERAQSRGAAAGLRWYNLQVSEAGPLIAGNPVNAVVQAVFKTAVLLDGFADVIDSYTPAAIADALGAIPASLLSLVEDNLNSLQESFTSFTTLVNGSSGWSGASLSNLAGLFGTAQRLNTLLGDVHGYAVSLLGSTWFRADQGEPDWTSAVDDGGNQGLLGQEAIRALEELRDTLAQLHVMGAFYGQDPADFRAWVEHAGLGGRTGPTLGRTSARLAWRRGDSLHRIAERYGVAPELILAASGLTVEDLRPGVEILIPAARASGSLGVSQLPVLDSHQGSRALGSDLDLAFEVEGGDLVVVSGADCLVQGLGEDLADLYDTVITDLDILPTDAIERWLQRKVGAALIADPRVATVREIAVSLEGDTGIVVNATVTAITGTEVEV